jgi:hypothetical protein
MEQNPICDAMNCPILFKFIDSLPFHLIPWSYVLTLSLQLHLDFPKILSPSGFPAKNVWSFFCHTSHHYTDLNSITQKQSAKYCNKDQDEGAKGLYEIYVEPYSLTWLGLHSICPNRNYQNTKVRN